MENETLIAENVEVDMETLTAAEFHHSSFVISRSRAKVVAAVVKALYPEDREKLEAYKNQ